MPLRQETSSGAFSVISSGSHNTSSSSSSTANHNMASSPEQTRACPSGAVATVAVASAYGQLGEVLSSFRCPRDCHLYDASYQLLINCPFGHSTSTSTALLDSSFAGQMQPGQLKKVPPAACVPALLKDCEKSVKTELIATSNSRSSSSGNYGNNNSVMKIAHCSGGIHFSIEQLVDLEHFYEQITAAKMAQLRAPADAMKEEVADAPADDSNFFHNHHHNNNNNSNPISASQTSFSSRTARERECAICLMQMTEGQALGLLSKCTHVFCARCLINWFRSPRPTAEGSLQTCPVCRSTTSFVLPWPQVINGRAEKRAIFDLQHEALHGISRHHLLVDDDNDEDDNERNRADEEEEDDHDELEEEPEEEMDEEEDEDDSLGSNTEIDEESDAEQDRNMASSGEE